MSGDAKKQYEMAKYNFKIISNVDLNEVLKLPDEQKQIFVHHLGLQAELYLKTLLLSYGFEWSELTDFGHKVDKLFNEIDKREIDQLMIHYHSIKYIFHKKGRKSWKNYKKENYEHIMKKFNSLLGLALANYRYASTITTFSGDKIKELYNSLFDISHLVEAQITLETRGKRKLKRGYPIEKEGSNQYLPPSSTMEAGNCLTPAQTQLSMANFNYQLTVRNLGDLPQDNKERQIFIYHLCIQAELYLKAILLSQGKTWSELENKGHNIKGLYNLLSDDTKEVVCSAIQILSNNDELEEVYSEINSNDFSGFRRSQLYRYADCDCTFDDEKITKLSTIVSKLRLIANQQELTNTLQNITPMNRRDRIQ